MQKNTYNRHLVCLKAFTFMDQYANLRLPGFKLDLREDQEGAGADDAEPEAEDAMEVVSVDGDDSDGGGGGGGSDDDPETAECATFHALTPPPPPPAPSAKMQYVTRSHVYVRACVHACLENCVETCIST